MGEKLLLSPEEACRLINVKRATFFNMLAKGAIPSIKIGRLRRIPTDALRSFVERQIAEQNENVGGNLAEDGGN
jgi:excisionase family DNA binding protein